MRRRSTIPIILFCLVLSLAARAQTPLLMSGMRFDPWSALYRPLSLGSPAPGKSAWQLYPYSGISLGTTFFNGSSINAIYAPVGLELYHPLSNRISAFAGVSVAPALFSYSRNFYNAAGQSGFTDPNAYRFAVNPRLEMGLMYTNEEHTFSISGSIGVERGTNYYPAAPANRPSASTKR